MAVCYCVAATLGWEVAEFLFTCLFLMEGLIKARLRRLTKPPFLKFLLRAFSYFDIFLFPALGARIAYTLLESARRQHFSLSRHRLSFVAHVSHAQVVVLGPRAVWADGRNRFDLVISLSCTLRKTYRQIFPPADKKLQCALRLGCGQAHEKKNVVHR